MIAVVSSGDAYVIGALLVFIAGMVTLYVQNKRVHRENRNDHWETASKVDRLLLGQHEIKMDVRDVKDDLRDHHRRIRDLEGGH